MSKAESGLIKALVKRKMSRDSFMTYFQFHDVCPDEESHVTVAKF